MGGQVRSGEGASSAWLIGLLTIWMGTVVIRGESPNILFAPGNDYHVRCSLDGGSWVACL
jgi:hypothetical protein